MAAIEVEGLSFRYAGRKRAALRDLSFRVHAGETVLVLGPSGCGKSTLALCLNGMIPHVIAGELSGSVSIRGQDVTARPLVETVRDVGIVFQDPEAQLCMLRVDEEVAFGLENLALAPDEMPHRIARALEATGLTCRGDTRIDWLSGGNKQRLALASVLAMEPSVLIFDEPTSNLDPAGARAVFAMIARLRSAGRHTIVVIEHRLDQLMHLVDRVLVLGPDGALLDDGEPHQVLERQARTLDEFGIWTPQVSELAEALRRRGVVLGGYPITVDEAHALLTREVQTTPCGGPLRRPADAGVDQTPWGGPRRRPGDAGVDQTPWGGPLRRPRDGGEQAAAWRSPLHTEDNPLVERSGVSAVSIRGLTAAYGRAPAVLRDVHLDVRQGDLLALVGPNGAGKSTLAHHLIATLRPSEGTVFVEGNDIRRMPPRTLAETVGYVFQNPEHQFVARTVFDELAFGLRLRGTPEPRVRQQVEAMLADFGLAGLAAANPFKLSHGEKRRLSVATMLILEQRILVLDEPTFGQDRRHAQALLEKFRALNVSGTTLIVITHDMRLVAEHASRAAVLEDGHVVADSGVHALFDNRAQLERAHLDVPPMRALSERLFGHQRTERLPTTVEDLAERLARQPVGAA